MANMFKDGNNAQGSGEPLANANARKGIEQNRQPKESIEDVTAMPMPMQSLIATPDDEYHYHWFGDTGDRIHYAKALGYEFVPSTEGGDPKSKDDARSTTGLVLMRTPKEKYNKRKRRIYNEVNPERERAPRESFKNRAAQQGVKTVDETTTSRGSMNAALANDE